MEKLEKFIEYPFGSLQEVQMVNFLLNWREPTPEVLLKVRDFGLIYDPVQIYSLKNQAVISLGLLMLITESVEKYSSHPMVYPAFKYRENEAPGHRTTLIGTFRRKADEWLRTAIVSYDPELRQEFIRVRKRLDNLSSNPLISTH